MRSIGQRQRRNAFPQWFFPISMDQKRRCLMQGTLGGGLELLNPKVEHEQIKMRRSAIARCRLIPQ